MFPYGPIPLLALVSWPVVTFFIFQRYRLPIAAGASTLGAMLFLPDGEAAIDFPLIPPLDKENIATLSLLAMMFLKHRSVLAQARLFRGIDLVPAAALIGILGTWQGNKEPIVMGFLVGVVEDAKAVTLPGLTFKDVIAYAVRDILAFLLPFQLARAIYRTREDLRDFLNIFVIFAITYIPLILVELRLSPLVHAWIYGYPPHNDFTQTMRWGGWRPQVFFYHGLYLSKFMFACSMCALALWLGKQKKAWRWDPKLVYIVLSVTTFFTKSGGIILYQLCFGLLFLRGTLRIQALIMLVLASITVFYPFGRASNLIPAKEIIEEIEKFAPDRASSLAYRFKNEIQISARARKKFWFGWGGWARGHIWDVKVGRNLSVCDGYWIIRLNEQGVFGLAGPFLVMLLPVIFACIRYRRIPWVEDQQMVLVLSSFCLVYAIECLPNAISTNIPFFVGGALWGIVGTLTNKDYIKRLGKKKKRRRPRPGAYPPPWYPPYPGYPAPVPGFGPSAAYPPGAGPSGPFPGSGGARAPRGEAQGRPKPSGGYPVGPPSSGRSGEE